MSDPDTPDRLDIDRAALIDLQPWAIAGRYPEDIPEPAADELRRLIDAAQRLVDDVRHKISIRDS